MIVKGPVGDFLDIFHAPYKKSGPFLAKVHLEWVHFSLQVSMLLILEKGGGRLRGGEGFKHQYGVNCTYMSPY